MIAWSWILDDTGEWSLTIAEDNMAEGRQGTVSLSLSQIAQIWAEAKETARTGKFPTGDTTGQEALWCEVGLHTLPIDDSPSEWAGDGWKRCLHCGAVVSVAEWQRADTHRHFRVVINRDYDFPFGLRMSQAVGMDEDYLLNLTKEEAELVRDLLTQAIEEESHENPTVKSE